MRDQPDPSGAAVDANAPLLEVEDLSVVFRRRGEPDTVAVERVGFTVHPGRSLGLVGESGCGKTVTALAITGLLPARGVAVSGSVHLGGRQLLGLPESALRDVRGRDLGMVFQDPLSALNPVVPVGLQVGEVLERHRGLRRRAAREQAAELLARVGIPDPRRRIDEYPHQLSGGMRQRALIAMALACRPRLLIADEPTTALDVTVQAQILALLRELVAETGTALILITHDLGVVAGLCDEVAVMNGGRIVERADRYTLFATPRHPYTVRLLAAVPRLDRPRPDPDPPDAAQPDLVQPDPARPDPAQPETGASGGRVLLVADGLQVHFPIRRGVLRDRTVGHVYAVDEVDLTVRAGEIYGLAGESGCGKSTLGRALLRLVEPIGGRVRFDGVDLSELRGERLRRMRRRMQMVFQDPLSSLDPRQSVRSLLAEGLRAHDMDEGGQATEQRLRELLGAVGLPAAALSRYPHEFSGGQRQRIGIARALSVRPDLVVADEPVSALDVSVQAQVIDLLAGLRRSHGLTLLVIAHDLAVLRQLSDRIGVMYLGGLVEEADAGELCDHPLHPYTRALLSAVPVPDPVVEDARRPVLLAGDVPSPAAPPSGCRFHTRCPWRRATRCADERPALRELRPGHRVACHWALDIAAEIDAEIDAELDADRAAHITEEPR